MPSRRQSARSPSPPSQAAPVSSAPGERAQRLQSIFDEALKHTLKPCTYDNFSACFPTPAKYEPDALREFHSEFLGRLDKSCRVEFANILHDRDVVADLNKLDTVLRDADKCRVEDQASGREPSQPPHLLPPAAVLDAHLAPFIAEQTADLTSRLEQVQKSNVGLAEDISAQRAEIDALVRGLEAAVADLDAAAAALDGNSDMKGVEDDLHAYAKTLGTT